MTSDELKNKLTKIALCDDGYRRVCLVNELEDELIKDLEVLKIFAYFFYPNIYDTGYKKQKEMAYSFSDSDFERYTQNDKEYEMMKKLKEWLENGV